MALPGLGSSTPVIWKDRLYVLAAIPAGGAAPASEPLVGHEFTVFAIKRSDGSVAWRRTARKEVPHEGQSFVVALDKKTGSELWRKNRDEATTWATPLIVEQAGLRQVVTSGTRKARSYDLATGELLWEAPGLTPNAIPTPIESPVYLRGYRHLYRISRR